MFVGIDFGTTNSTLAIADKDGAVELTRYGRGEAASETVRSVLYFDPEARLDGRPAPPVVGMDAINAYLAADSRGRFIQSIKSHMASRTFKSTQIGSRIYTIEQLVTHIVQALRDGSGRELPQRVVVGRPVHFVNDDADSDADAFAEQRLRRAFAAAGFGEVRFELEPVAAAYGYEQRLTRDELVLIADFGGGTTDLCLIDVGPGARARAARGEPRKVRASDGVALAGDAFDQRIIKHAIAPRLGLGTKYRLFDGDADVPLWLYNSLSRWHLLSFLKSHKTMLLLDDILANAYARSQIEMLYRIVDEDLGYALHGAVERTKVELSKTASAVIDFPAAALHMTITRAELEGWIAPDLAAIAAAVDRVLASGGVAPKDIDRVFMTGGTSLVPAVRDQFIARFGAGKIRGGEEMTTVGRGLALVARDVFGGAP
jgi:hypothetical chaperone protein